MSDKYHHSAPHGVMEDIVFDYLRENTSWSNQKIEEIIQKRQKIIQRGVDLKSYGYFIGNAIIRAEKENWPISREK